MTPQDVYDRLMHPEPPEPSALKLLQQLARDVQEGMPGMSASRARWMTTRLLDIIETLEAEEAE